MASVLWGIVLSLFGAQWVFPETVKEAVISWKGSFVGKKREKILLFVICGGGQNCIVVRSLVPL